MRSRVGSAYALATMAALLVTVSAVAHATSRAGWASVESMPTARNVLAVLASSDGRVFAIGGQGYDPVANAGTNLPDVEAYSTTSGVWTRMSDMPIGLSQPAAAADGLGRIYVAGGTAGVWPNVYTSDALAIYDEGTETWSLGPSMPTPRFSAGAALGSDGRLYVMGGISSTGESTNEAFDPGSMSWQDRAPIPTGRRGMTVVARDGLIYVIGGLHNGVMSNAVEIFNPASNSWTVGAPMPTRRAFAAGALGRDGRIYVAGGFDYTTFDYVGTVETYDTRRDTWETLSSSLAVPRANFGMTAGGPDGRLYAVGGEGALVGMMDSVESCRPLASGKCK